MDSMAEDISMRIRIHYSGQIRLTPEDEKELHRGAQALSLDIPKEAMLRAKCTHRDPATHNFTIRPADDGNGYVCMKCGAHFNVVDGHSMKEINEIIGGAIDILQTTKMMYVDMTPEVIQAYFVILPFLELAPKMYEAAVKHIQESNAEYNSWPEQCSWQLLQCLLQHGRKCRSKSVDE